MKNFLQVNRALAAEKNYYFILNQIKSNPDGGQTCDGNRQSRLMSYRCYLKNLAMIFAVLVMSVANIGVAWGAYDVPDNGTVTLSQKVNKKGRFNVEALGVYHFRLANGYAWDGGIKTKDNQCGVIFYLDASKEIEVGIKHTEDKYAHDVTVHVYSIPESEYKQFDDNKAGAAEKNRTFSTGPSTSSDDSFTISVAATSSTFTGTKTLAAGYYAVVPIGEQSNTYFTSIKFTPASPGYKLSVFNSSTNGEYNFVAGTGENEIVINDFVIPEYTAGGDSRQFWVGPGSFAGQAANEYFSWKRAYHQQNNSCTSDLTLGNPVNAIGTLHAWTNSDQSNYGLCFEPNGYGIVWGVENSPWTYVPFESTGEPTVWLTDIVSLTSDMISNYKYYVGLLTKDGGYVGSFRDQGNARGLSNTDNISGMRRKTASGNNWANGLVAGHGKFRIWVNNCTQNFYCHFVPHYKLTYNANGGSGAPAADYVSVEETPCQWTLSNKQPTWADHVFLGWSTNPSATVADADAEVADLGTPYRATGDVTLYAVWQACSGPNAGSSAWTAAGYTYNQNATANEMSLTGVTASNGGALSYQWYKTTSDVAHGEAISGATSNTYRPATDVAHADNWFYFCRVTEAGCSTTYTTPLSGAIVVNAASLTALECNTLYKVADMVPASITLSGTGQYGAGLSANTKFEVLGDPSKTDQAGGTPEMKNEEATINTIVFPARMYLKRASNLSEGIPTSHAVKFIVGESGVLDVYAHRLDRIYLKKAGGDAIQFGTSTSSTPTMVTFNVTAGTYYIYSTGGSTCVYGVRLNCCTTPAAPTEFTAGSITSTGATFTITDAANAASYDIYYSTSNSAPDAGKAATTTSTEKTKAVTGLTANTTYYAWVRSVCDADHKSAWVALGTTSFATAAVEPEALVHWTMNVAKDGAWRTTATSTTDGTNISSIGTSHDEGDNKGKSSATPKTAMADAEVTTAAEPTKSAKFTFTVKAAKKVVPEKVTCEVFNVSAGDRTYKAQISDSNGHVYNSTNTVAVSTEATLTPATFTFASDLVLTGNVTVKIYAWGSGSEFRMGQHVKLFGEVDDYNCTALNLTRGGQESGTYTVGNYTGNPLTCTVNEGEPASYQWKQYTQGQGEGQAVNAVGSGSKTTSFTPNPASANTYFYACEVTDICGNTSRTPYTGTFVFNAAAPTYTVTHSLTNVTATSGATGAGAATEGVAYDAVFAANSGYVLPSTITVTIGGSPATVGTGYTWNASTGAFQVLAAQVTGDIVVTIAGETAPAGDCEELVHTEYLDGSHVTTSVGSATLSSPDSQSNYAAIKLSSSGYIELSPKAGSSFAVGDSLIVTMFNSASSAKTTGYRIAGIDYTASMPSRVKYTFRRKLIAEDIVSSKVKIERASVNGSNSYFYSAIIKHCGLLPSCTPPVLPDLTTKTVCEGRDADAAWDATITNSGSLASGETVAYSWVKKGGSTPVSSVATYRPTSVTEAMAGTYIVTATVSVDGKASKSATKEVTLTVNEATEVTGITADKATVYPTNSVTLTATANVTPQSWEWFTCTNAEGAGEAIISGATSASYTITPERAGTYYYKVKATGNCGIAERVYTLVVSQPSECIEWAGTPSSLTNNSMVVSENLILGVSGASIGNSAIWSGSGNITHFQINSSNYYVEGHFADGSDISSVIVSAATNQSSSKTYAIVFSPDDAFSAGLTVYTHSAPSVNVAKNESNLVHEFTAPANTQYFRIYRKFTYSETEYGDNQTIRVYGIEACAASSCADATPTIAAANTTVCEGNELSITASGYETSPESIQWQKLNSSTSTWDNISDASSATYTVAQATAADAGSYRVVVTKGCARTSNTVTIAVPSKPVFGAVTSPRSVMATQALSISDVAASDATSYAWYKSADETYDAGTDTRVGTAQELLLVSGGEAAGDIYYLFCVASNSCGSTTSSAITVNVIALVEEECATKGSESAAEFGFEKTGCSEETYSETACWKSGGRAYYLTYSAPTGKYLKEAKVTVASTKDSKCGYAYSTDNGTNWTYVELTGLSTTLTEKTIDLSGNNVTDFRIGRNLQDGSLNDWGSTTGAFYLSKICFEYSNTCTATTVTPSTSSVDYTKGGDWTDPTFTVKHEETTFDPQPTLTYSSSNENIASVDESGNVTFNGKAGTVTITASYAGNATYCASEGSYTITVSCSGGAPKIVAANGTNMSDCNSSITLNAKTQNDTDFADGTYQWFHNGVEIEGATSSSYTAIQTGVYTVEYKSAGGCTSPSTNHATVTSDNVEPEVERLVPFQYYHVDKPYSAQMKDRHLFSVKGSAEYGSTGKNFKLTMSRNSGEAVDITTAASIFVTKSGDGQVDTVMIDLNQLRGKYSEGDKLVLTCAAIDCNGNASAVYKDEITIHVIDAKPTLALICSGTNIAAGTRKTSELTVGGDFLTGYNKADLCLQTGNTTFDANIEWGLYTDLKAKYIVTPVNGYAVFNKLNYEPFDILLLTDYPKASKSPAAATVLDDMADLCDYRPMLSFKTHMVQKSPSKWAAKGFTTSPVVTKADGRLNLNIVCYAHPMFASLKTGDDVYKDNSDLSQLVYTMLSEPGYESSKGMQGFELAAAENFVTIGLTHYNASIAKNSPSEGKVTWTPNDGDRMLVTVAERQTNIEARFILFSLNCGAQSKLTEKGEDVVLACLNYLLGTAEGTIEPADCSFTFDDGKGNKRTPEQQATNCPSCPPAGDHKWSNPANWGPDYCLLPGEFNSARIAAPVTVDMEHAKAMELRIIDDGSITIPAGKALEVKSTIRRMDGTEIYPTEISDIHIGSASTGNGTLIFDNNTGDTKAQVDMYSKGKTVNGTKNYQYIGTPFNEINALYNYYGARIYSWNGSGWTNVKNGGSMTAWTGYCISSSSTSDEYYQTSGTLTATTMKDITVPAGANMVIGNSWTAPIDIKSFTDDDFENLNGNVYFFNTGVDVEGTGTVNPSPTGDTRWAAGTYASVPIHAASYTGTDDHIPSLQGFFVKSNGSAGTLHLDYDRHVRGTTRGSILSGEMHAPARRAAVSSNEPAVLKIKVSGEKYDDKLLLLEREDFTTGKDFGWDGDKWDGNESALYIYTTDNNGTENSVSAIPELEGTVIGFRAGEDDAYTLNFEYLNSDEPLYLYDVENNTYTPIMTGMTYRFFTTDNEKHARFIITRSNGQEVATGVGEVPSDQVQGTKAKKLLIENKMFIMVNGMLYDATGKIVK